jgi:hypothetical protein
VKAFRRQNLCPVNVSVGGRPHAMDACVGMLHDLNRPAERLLRPGASGAPIAAVRPNMCQAWRDQVRCLKECLGTFAIGDIGRLDLGLND